MQTIIRFLIDLSVAGLFVATFAIVQSFVYYRRFKRKFKPNQYIHFYVGHEQRFGVIVKIKFTKALVRDALDRKEYYKPFYQIHNPYHYDH